MDATDAQIIDILRREGRASFSRIGREVGLSTNAVASRVRRAERQGVIVGYRAVLADEIAERPGGVESFIDVRLDGDRDSDDFLAWVRDHRAVMDAVHLTGAYDYLLRVRVPDMKTLDALLRELKTAGGVAQTHTRIALR